MFKSHEDLPDGKLVLGADSCEIYIYRSCQASICNNSGAVREEVDAREATMKLMHPLMTVCVVNKKRGFWHGGEAEGVVFEVRTAGR